MLVKGTRDVNSLCFELCRSVSCQFLWDNRFIRYVRTVPFRPSYYLNKSWPISLILVCITRLPWFTKARNLYRCYLLHYSGFGTQKQYHTCWCPLHRQKYNQIRTRISNHVYCFIYNYSSMPWLQGRISKHPDSKVRGANMGPIWGRQDPGGPHVGPMNFAIWAAIEVRTWINNCIPYVVWM